MTSDEPAEGGFASTTRSAKVLPVFSSNFQIAVPTLENISSGFNTYISTKTTIIYRLYAQLSVCGFVVVIDSSANLRWSPDV